MKIEKYSDISTMIADNTMGFTNTIGRSNPIPLDKSSIYDSMEAALAYINADGTAYDGQIIAVKDSEGKQKAYIVDSTSTTGLVLVGDNTTTVELSTKLYGDGTSTELKSKGDIGYLSAEIKQIQDVSLGELSSYDVSVLTADSSDAGILKTYTIKQGETTVGTINIPKDFLVKSATVKECTHDDDPIIGLKVGDKYIDFVINAKDGDATSEHVYLNVKDLTDVYTGSENGNIKITVNSDNSISAEFGTTFINWINSVNVSADTLSDAIEALAGTTADNLAAAKTELSNTLSSYTNTEVAKTLESAKSYSDTLSNAISSAAKAYTDEKIADLNLTNTLSTLSVDTLNAANNYTDSEIVKAKSEAIDTAAADATTKANAAQAAAEATAAADATTKADAALTNAKSYTNEVSSSLSTTISNNYALTSTVSSISAGLDTRLTSVETNKLAKDEFETLSNAIGLSAASSTNTVVTQKDIAALTNTMHFIGVTTTELSTGSKAKPTINGSEVTTLTAGDIVLGKDAKEFIWDGEQWCEIGDESLYATSAELEAEVAELESADKTLQANIDAEATARANADTTLQTNIDTEADARAAADTVLSGAIDNKVYVNGLSVDSLSVVNIAQEDYHNLVTEGEIDPNTVYIVSADNYNMYGQKIVNLADPTDDTDAANKQYVDNAIDAVSTDLDNRLTTAEGEIDALQNSYISAITLNGESYTVNQNVAALSISYISCGNATSD